MPRARTRKPLRPNSLSRDSKIAEIIRVDHAGEYGAVRIYEGQLAVFRHLPHKKKMTATLKRMADEEAEHLARFDTLVTGHSVRPTVLAPVWHAAGFALGAATALLGEKAALACTVAVEEVIDEHYAGQIETLDTSNPDEADLAQTIEKFRKEEIAHKDEALAQGAAEAPGYPLLSGAIKTACRLAIRLSEKA